MSAIENAPAPGVLSRDQAQEVVDQVRFAGVRALEALADYQKLFALAYDGKAWLALGYKSWQELCDAEFSFARLVAATEERAEWTQRLLEAGMSTRAVGTLLGVGPTTVRRDRDSAAGAPNGAPAKPRGPVQGIDGKAYQRPTQVERVERGLKVAELSAQGLTQAQIAERVGVSQRTVSSDERMVEEWLPVLSEAERERLESGRMSRTELAQQVGLELSDAPSSAYPRMVTAAFQGLEATVAYVQTEVFEKDEFVIQGETVASTAAAGLARSVERLAEALSEEMPWGVVDPQVADAVVRSVETSMKWLSKVLREATPHEGTVPVEPRG